MHTHTAHTEADGVQPCKSLVHFFTYHLDLPVRFLWDIGIVQKQVCFRGALVRMHMAQ